jgi:hypothetical protein
MTRNKVFAYFWLLSCMFTCSLSYAENMGTVYYGVPINIAQAYAYKEVKGQATVNCSNQFFGKDPAPGYKKVCYVVTSESILKYPTNTVQSRVIAKEGETFTVPAGTTTGLGYRLEAKFGQWYPSLQIPVGTKVNCSNTKFMLDPFPGNKKLCYVGRGFPVAGSQPVASEGQTFTMPSM